MAAKAAAITPVSLTSTAAGAVGTIPSGPALGYNTWYQFGANLTEAAVLKQANLLVSTGLAKLGYNTVNLDDTWMASTRTSAGALTWNTAKFPGGIPALAAKIHAMGLKFGIYEAVGSRTCKGLPGSWGHFTQDARTFASWGVDFVKIDECGGLPADATAASATTYYEEFDAALRAANPSVVYSEELPVYTFGTSDFGASVQGSSTFANMWRVAPDERPLEASNAYSMVTGHLADDLHLHAFAGPGHWNDLDMVAPGMPSSGWTLADLENQLSIWAEEASPLLISADLSQLTSAEIAALGNRNMLAIDQSGSQAPLSITHGHIEVVLKDVDGYISALFVNTGTGTASAKFTLSQLYVSGEEATCYNVWTGKQSVFGGVVLNLAPGQTALALLR